MFHFNDTVNRNNYNELFITYTIIELLSFSQLYTDNCLYKSLL